MSVASELEAMSTNIGAAYDAVSGRGGTLPANKNLDNLTTAVSSIPSGGKTINTSIYTFPKADTSATSYSFSVNKSGGSLSVEINPWEAQTSTAEGFMDGGNLTLTGKYPWELPNCNNGVFEFSYSVNGATAPWQTVSVAAKTGGYFAVGSENKIDKIDFMPLYTDWENMTFTFLQNNSMRIIKKDGTSAQRSVSGKVYESSTKVEYLYSSVKDSTATFIGKDMGFYLYHPCDGFTTNWPKAASWYDITEIDLSDLSASLSFGASHTDWATSSGNSAQWVYDAAQNMLVSAVNKAPKISFYIKEGGTGITDPRPVIRLWVSDELTIEEALASLAASKAYIVASDGISISPSTPVWSLPQEIRSMWGSATVINGQNSITAASSPSSKFAISGSVKAPTNLDEAYPNQSECHVENMREGQEYDAYICVPDGYTPPDSVRVW